MTDRLNEKHPKNEQDWKELDEEMKNKLEKAADLFVKNVFPLLKKLSKE